ncbi:MAG: T9SS type A sorting domain-containing protein [Gracilimonas sp.]|nr:T9SS type A sorting domain-containing protein [Gracilimonas sp.]
MQLFLTLILVLATGSYLNAQDIIAEDHAGNYSASEFEALENLGTGFGAWTKNVNGDDASVNVKDATGVGSNGSVLNTSGQAFVLIASDSDQSGNQVELGREFSAPLSDGSTFSFQFSWNWADGLKGFTLYNGGWDSADTAIKLDFDKSGYYVNGDSVEAHASQEDWDTWRGEGVSLEVTFTRSGENLDYTVTAITEDSHVDFNGTVEGVNADRVNFFNYYQADWGTDDKGSMFINNLKITSGEATSNEVENIARSFRLDQNYPNPFNPTTSISYAINSPSNIQLAVYNMLGQEIQVLEQGMKAAGNYSVNFDASNLNSGMYLYQLKTKAGTITRKMMLIK